jgi:hypothetical protein
MKKQTKNQKMPLDAIRVTSRDKNGKVIYSGRFVWERRGYQSIRLAIELLMQRRGQIY